MDIQADKLDIIEWLARVEDDQIVSQFKALKNFNQQQFNVKLTDAEKVEIDQGLSSIQDEKTYSHESVMNSTKRKYPHLFK